MCTRWYSFIFSFLKGWQNCQFISIVAEWYAQKPNFSVKRQDNKMSYKSMTSQCRCLSSGELVELMKYMHLVLYFATFKFSFYNCWWKITVALLFKTVKFWIEFLLLIHTCGYLCVHDSWRADRWAALCLFSICHSHVVVFRDPCSCSNCFQWMGQHLPCIRQVPVKASKSWIQVNHWTEHLNLLALWMDATWSINLLLVQLPKGRTILILVWCLFQHWICLMFYYSIIS